jgi:hypothetical protein
MKPKNFKYILFLFAKHTNQDEYVVEIAEEIAILTKSNNIKFYYGPEASVYTFSTSDTLKDIKEYLDIILSECKSSYFLLPYETDKLSFGLPDDISSHLFNDSIPDKKSEFKLTERKLSDFPTFNEEMFEDIMNHLDDEDDDDEISKLIKRTKEVKVNDFVTEDQFNEILSKISDKGMGSLSEKELSLLKKYSNQIK